MARSRNGLIVCSLLALVASLSVLPVAASADPPKPEARPLQQERRSADSRTLRAFTFAQPPVFGLPPTGFPSTSRPSPYQPLLDAGGLIRLHPLGNRAPFISIGGTLNARLDTDPVTGAPVWRNDDFRPTITFGKKL